MLGLAGFLGVVSLMVKRGGEQKQVQPKQRTVTNKMSLTRYYVNHGTTTISRRADGKPAFYIIINNVAKKQNIGTMMRSAAAFGAAGMFVVGKKKSTTMFGSFGTQKHVRVAYFDKLQEAIEHCKSIGLVVWGVEIDSRAVSIVKQPFTGSVAFLMGNEGHGLSEKERKFIDRYVYIPHHGNGTASLNVTVASSIIFQHYATWAGYDEIVFEGQKMVVDPPKVKTEPDANDLQIRAERKAKQETQEETVDNVAGMFGGNGSASTGDY